MWTALAWPNQGSRTRSTSRWPTLLPFLCRLSCGSPSYLANVAAAVLTTQFAFPAIKIVCDPRVNDPVISINEPVLVSISLRHDNRLLHLAELHLCRHSTTCFFLRNQGIQGLLLAHLGPR